MERPRVAARSGVRQQPGVTRLVAVCGTGVTGSAEELLHAHGSAGQRVRTSDRAAVLSVSVQIAMPISALMIAVAILASSSADVVNGRTAATTVTSAMIQLKKENGDGVDTSNACIRPVAISPPAKATSA